MFQMKKLTDTNWTTLPEPKKEGITITDEPIWASNTGRGSDGKMVGDIVAWKTTIQVEWAPLSFSQSQTIANALKGAGAFFQIRYNDFDARQSASYLQEKTVYCSNLPRTIYSLAQLSSPSTKTFQYHTGITVTFIEQ